MAKSPNTKPPNPAAYVNPFPLLSQLAQAFYHSHGKLTDRHQEQELAEEMRRPSRTSTGAQGHRLWSPGVSKVSPAAEADTVSLDGGHLVQSQPGHPCSGQTSTLGILRVCPWTSTSVSWELVRNAEF